MPRIRFIKHDFFTDDDLAQQSHIARLLFIGLWTLADREGRLEDKPAKIKAVLFPYEQIDAEHILAELACGFITRYKAKGKAYIQINNFLKHQRPHHKEVPSTIPKHESSMSQARVKHESSMSQSKRLKSPDYGLRITDSGLRISSPSAATPESAEMTPIQRIVGAYKVAKGNDRDDKAWDKANFARYSKAAKSLHDVFGDDKAAVVYLLGQAAEWDERGVTWTLETIARHAWDNKAKLTEAANGLKHSPMGSNSVLESRGPGRIAQAGALARETLRGIEKAGEKASKLAGPVVPSGNANPVRPDPILAREDGAWDEGGADESF